MEDKNKKTFNYTVLFISVYAILAILVLLYIWWPRDSKVFSINSTYTPVDAKKKAIEMYSVKLKYLLSKGDLKELYKKINDEYINKNNLNENNFQNFLEQQGYIGDIINVVSADINIQDNDIYVYRFLCTNNNRKYRVNLIETNPYDFTISFEQDVIPIVNNTDQSNSNSVSGTSIKNIIDGISYEVKKDTVRDNGINYNLIITNNSDKTVKFSLDNITNVSVVLDNGKEAYLGGAVVTSDDDILSPNSYLEKNLFFAVSSSDQNRIKTLRIRNVRIDDQKKTVNISL